MSRHGKHGLPEPRARGLVRLVSLLIVLGAIACAPPEPGVEPVAGVSVAQVDFAFEEARHPDSGVGELRVDRKAIEEAAALDGGYVNVFTDDGWVVQNLPIPADFDYPSVTTQFDLGQEGDVTSLSAYVAFGPEPVTSFEDGPRATYPVGTRVVDAEGFVAPTVSRPMPPPAGGLTFVAKRAVKICCQPDHVVVETADDQCAPEAVASSLDWLRTTYETPIPDPHVAGLGADGSLVGQLDGDMNRTFRDRRDGDPVSGRQVLEGKLEYLDRAGIHDLDIRHQGGGNADVPAGDFSEHGLTSVEAGRTPTTRFIIQQLCKGEDVELGFLRPGGGGHFVEVVCAGRVLGIPFISYVSDLNQSDDTDGVGDTQQSFLVDTDGDGRPNFVGDENGANVELVVTQSPPKRSK